RRGNEARVRWIGFRHANVDRCDAMGICVRRHVDSRDSEGLTAPQTKRNRQSKLQDRRLKSSRPIFPIHCSTAFPELQVVAARLDQSRSAFGGVAKVRIWAVPKRSSTTVLCIKRHLQGVWPPPSGVVVELLRPTDRLGRG